MTQPLPGFADRGPIPRSETTFGTALNLHKHLPPRTRAIVIARREAGLRPSGLLLPHQVYEKNLDPHVEYAVLPVLSPWLYITGKNAGKAHRWDAESDPYGDLLDRIAELEEGL